MSGPLIFLSGFPPPGSENHDAMAMTRRTLLVTGAAGACALALSGCAAGPQTPARGMAFLTEADLPLARALTLGIVGDAVQADAQRADAVAGFDAAISGLPPAVRAEVRQLLNLLQAPIVRPALTGIWGDWQNASPQSVTSFLARWRASNMTLLRSGYAALHALVSGGWYGQPQSWSATGYPGPPPIA